MVDAVDPARCPLCGRGNACGAAAGAATCWCFGAVVPPDVLARVPAAAVGEACVCADCAAGRAPSPCTGTCELDPDTARCGGCGRTMAEIERWPGMDEGERRALLRRLADARARR